MIVSAEMLESELGPIPVWNERNPKPALVWTDSLYDWLYENFPEDEVSRMTRLTGCLPSNVFTLLQRYAAYQK